MATGDAVLSAAGSLTAGFLFPAVRPGVLEDDNKGKLRATVLNSLRRAEEKGIQRIAFPAMGAGYGGFPWIFHPG